jgi:hypothetical protein
MYGNIALVDRAAPQHARANRYAGPPPRLLGAVGCSKAGSAKYLTERVTRDEPSSIDGAHIDSSGWDVSTIWLRPRRRRMRTA